MIDLELSEHLEVQINLLYESNRAREIYERGIEAMKQA